MICPYCEQKRWIARGPFHVCDGCGYRIANGLSDKHTQMMYQNLFRPTVSVGNYTGSMIRQAQEQFGGIVQRDCRNIDDRYNQERAILEAQAQQNIGDIKAMQGSRYWPMNLLSTIGGFGK